MREPKGCGAFPRTQRREIELHDSKVKSVQVAGGQARVRLSAYLRVSNGEAGTGWEQDLDLVVGGAALIESPPDGLLWITAGAVLIEGSAHHELALPLEVRGAVRVELEGAEGRLVLTGISMKIEERGDPRFIERLA